MPEQEATNSNSPKIKIIIITWPKKISRNLISRFLNVSRITMYVSQNLSMSSLKMSSLPWHQLMKGKNMQRMGMVRTVWSIATFVTIVLSRCQFVRSHVHCTVSSKKNAPGI